MPYCNNLCCICDESYNQTNRRPLLLPCGHSNCKQCLDQIESIGSKECSYCRMEWEDKEVSELPVCYQLMHHSIPIDEDEDDEEENAAENIPESTKACISLCVDHNFSYIFWCYDCQTVACKMCFIEIHLGIGCGVGLLEDTVAPEYVQFNKAVANIRASVSKKNTTIMSCIEINSRRLSDIQKFIETLQEHEKKLCNHDVSLKVKQSEIRDNLKLLDAKLNAFNVYNLTDGTSEEELVKLQEEKTAIRRMDKSLQLLDKPKSLTLDRVTTAYQELEDDPSDARFITAFSRLCSFEATDITIVVDNDSSALAALMQLFSTYAREPQFNCLVVAGPSNVPQLTRVELLLPMIAKLCGKEIRIRLLDSFWGRANAAPNATVVAIEPDSKRLNDFLASVERVKLRELYGSLDPATVTKLNGLSLDAIGLTVSTADDVTFINSVCSKHSNIVLPLGYPASPPTYNIQLKNLHVSIIAEVNSSSVIPLTVFTTANLGDVRCFLHFPRISDDRLRWMMKVVSKLVPIESTPERLAALCLPDCNISTSGAEMLLGFLHCRQLTARVYLDDKKDAIGEDYGKQLQERYQNRGIKLEFKMMI